MLPVKTSFNIGEGLQLAERPRRRNLRVFVLNQRGKPLMPCSPGKARVMLKEGKAKVVKRTPFTVQLTIATGETKQPVTLGVDCGYRNVGLSATTEKAELFASEVELRHDIVDLLSTRRELRSARRNRKTRYRAPRFLNRVHSKNKGWLAPSVENRVGAHLSRVRAIAALLPLAKIVVETAAFDIAKIKNPAIAGEGYQQGEQMGFWNVREYVLWRDGHRCRHCGGKSKDPVLNVHHLESRKTGGDTPSNLITLCETCHKAFHRGEIKLSAKRGRSFKAEAFMGIMRWAFFNRLKAANPGIDIRNTYGYLTKWKRINHGIEKTHCADAFCIAGNLDAKRDDGYLFQKQTRKHNRQIYKMSILKGGVRKRNQAPYDVMGFRLFDKVRLGGRECFIFARRLCGSFDVRTLGGERLSAGVSHKRLSLVEKRKTYLAERRTTK